MRSTWPLLAALGVFFVLSVNSPRGWETVARNSGIRSSLASNKAKPLPAAPQVDPSASQPLLATLRGTTIVAPAAPLANQVVVTPAPAATETKQQPALADISSEPVVRTTATPQVTVTPPAPATTVAPAPAAAPVETKAPESVASLPKRTPDLSVPATLAPKTASTPAVSSWTAPTQLVEQLIQLSSSSDAQLGAWARRAAAHVQALGQLPSLAGDQAHQQLGELAAIIGEGNAIQQRLGETPLAVELRRANYALTKRVGVWERLARVDVTADVQTAQADPQRLSLCLAEVEDRIDGDVEGAGWREYIMIDALKSLTAEKDAAPEQERRRLVQRILDRFERRNISQSQHHFLNSEPMARLKSELRLWSAEPADTSKMLTHLEQFEQSTLPSDAHLLALDYGQLKESPDEASAELAKWIDTHYRNANLRISLSSELLNRLIPEQEPRSTYVRDMFMGYPTRGWSKTHTDVAIRFIPDSHRVRMQFEARGKVNSDTNTSSGPVTVYTTAQSPFVAERELEVSLTGIHMTPVDVQAQTYPRLKAIKSELDHVPVVGPLVQRIARNKNNESYPIAKAQAVHKIRNEVSTRIDNEMAPKVVQLNQKIHDRVLTPLDEMEITPELIEASTTEDRMTMRVRVCGAEQLAGHSPRPRAPENNLANIQVHQSLLNNICEQLGWNGRHFTLDELKQEVSTRFNVPMDKFQSTTEEDLSITFADRDALRVRCDDGRIELSLAVAQLKAGRDHWEDFVIRVYYKPDLSGGQAMLVRDGTVQLIGKRLGARGQLALRGVASKIFPSSKGYEILPEKVHQRPGFEQIGVTQFDIRDGWIGMALADVPMPVAQTSSRRVVH